MNDENILLSVTLYRPSTGSRLSIECNKWEYDFLDEIYPDWVIEG